MNGIEYDATPIEMLLAAVFSCIDPRLLKAVISFLEQELELRLGTYVLINQAGGAAGMARPNREKADRSFKQAEFPLMKFPQITRVIFIVHDLCGLYLHLREKYPDFFGAGGSMAEKQVMDHTQVAMMIRQRWPKVTVEIYHAVAIGEGPKKWTIDHVLTMY